jgi:serralysin
MCGVGYCATDNSGEILCSLKPGGSAAIDSDGSGPTFAKSIAENTTAVTTVHATDPDNGPVTPVSYAIVPGDDGAKFAIDATSGVLTFITAPDFENPTDTATAGSNTYIVTVQASDGILVDQQTSAPGSSRPVIPERRRGRQFPSTSMKTPPVTIISTDQDSGADADLFAAAALTRASSRSIPTGVLTFNSAPNFEALTDNGDNGYGRHRSRDRQRAPNLHDQAINVHVQNVNEAPATGAARDRNATRVDRDHITGTDVDAGDSAATFHITNIPNAARKALFSDAGLMTQVTRAPTSRRQATPPRCFRPERQLQR